MESTKKQHNIKQEGQVFTPAHIVIKMLDIVNYKNDNILYTTILEPSFGDGAFLVQILERLLCCCQNNNKTIEETKEIIKSNIFGIEKDEKFYNEAITRLNKILEQYNIFDFNWNENLFCDDTLSNNSFDSTFDIVIGNPPYINIHNIDDRDIVKQYSFCKNGMTDLYICFFEKGLKMLNDKGKLCFITPNSYFNSVAGREMRKHIIKNHLLTKVINFGHEQIFNNVTTYSCITLLDKENTQDVVNYTGHNNFDIQYVDFFINNNFYFSQNKNFKDIICFNENNYATVKNGIATLNDKFFINSDIAQNSIFSIPIIKSSTGVIGRCFYPYDKQGNKIPLDIIQKEDKTAYDILMKNEELLKNRALQNTDDWYVFGRTQALKDTYKNKFAINSLFKTKKDVRIVPAESGTTVYSGLYILTELSIDELKLFLISDEFIDYCNSIAKYKSGGYFTISSNELSAFINYKKHYDRELIL